MTAPIGADERAARRTLRRLIEGPPATQPPAAAPLPGQPSGDWWERLYDPSNGDHAGAVPKQRRIPPLRVVKPGPERVEPDADSEWEDAEGDDESTPQAVKRSRQRQQVTAAWVGMPARTQWLLSTGAGAGCGWLLGLEQAMRSWIDGCGHDQGVTAALVFGVGLVAVTAYAAHRARAWWPPLAWCCRIPFATALLALCLYAPGVTP